MPQPLDSQKSQLPPTSTQLKAASTPAEQTLISRSMIIKGELSGTESLYIEGRIEGTVDFAGHHVTIGRNGSVAANISAREIVILGKAQGNIQCTDRVHIRSEGSFSGDVLTQRISVEEGAILEGSVQIRAVEPQIHMSQQVEDAETSAELAKPSITEQPKAMAAAAGSHASFPAARQEVGASFADRAGLLIRKGYKPKDAVELVLQDIALEYRNDPSIMKRGHTDAEDFLLKIRKGLI